VKEPLRLRDDPGMPEQLRSALRGGITPLPMTSAERARCSKRVAALVAVPFIGTTLLGWKGVVLAAVAIGTGTVATALVGAPWQDAPTEPTPAPLVAPSATAAAATPQPAPDPSPSSPSASIEEGAAGTDPAPQATLAPSARARLPAAATASAAEPEDTLRAEAAILERARARAAGDPAGALAILDEHARQFPRGKLSVERELIAVDVLRRAGRSAEARARGEALLARTRGGLYEQRVRALLESLP
jgi:hypothetical protein